jgi:hypothetical protein
LANSKLRRDARAQKRDIGHRAPRDRSAKNLVRTAQDFADVETPDAALAMYDQYVGTSRLWLRRAPRLAVQGKCLPPNPSPSLSQIRGGSRERSFPAPARGDPSGVNVEQARCHPSHRRMAL